MSKLDFDANTLNPKGKALYDGMVAKRKSQGAPFGGPYAALMNHPELCQKIEALGYYLKFEGHLPRNIYQFVVLAVAKTTNASFEWNDHIKHAQEAGVPQAIIDQLHTEELDSSFSEPYQLIAELLTATLKWKNIPEQVQDNVIKTYGVEGLIEVVVLSGFYQMFSAINQGFDIR
jgi:4-carboxymuconolactone decarboxylase